MKRSIVLLFSLACAAMLLCTGCKSEPGFGGQASINGNVLHHTDVIPDAIVYLAFGATEFPGADVDLYDHSVAADGAGLFRIGGLEKGDYYLYGVGFDPAVSAQVTGGIGINIEDSEQNLFQDVSVTE